MKSDLSSTISVIEKSSKKVRFNESTDNRLNDTSSPKSLKPKRKYGIILMPNFFNIGGQEQVQYLRQTLATKN